MDFLTIFYNKEAKQKSQKIENCWWVHPKAGILDLAKLQAITKTRESLKETKLNEAEAYTAYKNAIASAEELYKRFSEFSRIQILIEYLQNLKTMAPRGHQLIKDIAEKLESKKWKYAFKDYFKKEEIMYLLQQYRDNYRLGPDFQPLPSEFDPMEIG